LSSPEGREMTYYMQRRFEGGDFESVVGAVHRALGDEGFGALTEIDVQATLRQKLGEEMDPFLIIGACNPPFAHRALELEPEIGVLLPCNLVVRVDGDAVVVDAMSPSAVLSLVDSPGVGEVAIEVEDRLQRVLAAL
jgi:uncharacterized protein (DUF302 family)